MLRTATIVLAFFSCISIASAQQSFQVGIGTGITHFYGDLGNEPVVQWGSTQPGVSVTIRNFLPKPASGLAYYPAFNVELRFTWNRLQYDETKPIGSQTGFDLRNYGRGLGFRNDLFGASIHGTYTFYQNKSVPLHMQGPALFVFGGVGMFYGKPKADLFMGSIDMANRYYFWFDGTVRDAPQESGQGNIIQKDGVYETNLADWMTEGAGYKSEPSNSSPYNFMNVGFPVGFGIRQGLTPQITLSMDFGYYFFLTDFLDDVSDAYPTYAEINANFPNDPVKQALALYISDPTGWGTNGYPGPATSRRGNPVYKDAFTFINLEVAYTFRMR
mgnify:CR=1 FL=1